MKDPNIVKNLQPIDRSTWQNAMSNGASNNLLSPIGLADLEDKHVRDFLKYVLSDSGANIGDTLSNTRSVLDGSLLERADVVEASQRGLEGASPDEIKQVWGQAVSVVTFGVKMGVAKGYIPPSVESSLSDNIRSTKLGFISKFLLGVLTSGALAVYDNKFDRIMLGYDRENKNTMTETMVHEMVHRLSGGRFTDDLNGTVGRPRVGFSDELNEFVLTRTGLNEAMTEHTARAFLSGDFETIDPDEIVNDSGSYYKERKILARFIDASNGIFTMKDMMRAFFEDTAETGALYRRSLVRKVHQAYGIGALRKVNGMMNLIE